MPTEHSLNLPPLRPSVHIVSRVAVIGTARRTNFNLEGPLNISDPKPNSGLNGHSLGTESWQRRSDFRADLKLRPEATKLPSEADQLAETVPESG